MSFRATVLTLYPEMFPGPLGISLSGRGLSEGAWSLETVQIRDFATDRHRSVDDTPSGGGAGMVLRADVLARAIDQASPPGDLRPRLLMSPRGRPLAQAKVRELAAGPGAIVVCGRFEGVDQRVIDSRGLEEISIGDYILSGGEPAAMVLLDAIVRLLPGIMGNALSGQQESFENDLLEHPHYTRPQEFEGMPIPEVLTSGNHSKIEAWRLAEAEKLTRERRPDIFGQSLGSGITVETNAALRFFGDDLDPYQLTELLGRHPTSSKKKGEPERSGRPSRTGRWLYSIDIEDGDNLDRHINLILSGLTQNTIIWRELTSKFQSDLICGVWLLGKPGIELSADTMQRLGERGLRIDFDIYLEENRVRYPVTK